MKRQIIFAFFAILLFAAVALASRRSGSGVYTLNVSCGFACPTTGPIVYSGTGYKAKQTVQLEIVGPSSYTITTIVDANGNINVDYGTVLPYLSGEYTVTASAISGKTLIPLHTTQFAVVE